MNASILKRLFQAIANKDFSSIEKISRVIIDYEKDKGHLKLAKYLEELINTNQENKKVYDFKVLREINTYTRLPKSKRDNQPLARIIEPTDLNHFMILNNDVEEKFKIIEKEYAARERLAHLSLRPRKKILLYGPSGCGKTLGAQRLAWNTGLPLMKVSFDTIISSFFGESASNLRTIFESSKEVPCVLLLDECDFIAKSRNLGKDVGEVPRIVNMLLTLLDEYDSPGLLVATTNLEESLDKAIFRRFDDIIRIDPPGTLEIKEIMKVTLSTIKTSEKIDWDFLSKKLEGSSASFVVEVSQRAAKYALLYKNKNDLLVEQKDIEKSISTLSTHKIMVS